jgi:hypothetical protein
MELDMNRILAINTEIESLGPMETNSTDALIEIGTRLAGYLPYTGQQMAMAKKIMLDKRAVTYEVLMSKTSILSASNMKDYIASKTSDDQYNYDVCERCNRSIVHVLDYLRSVLSTLKEEMKISQYNNFNT